MCFRQALTNRVFDEFPELYCFLPVSMKKTGDPDMSAVDHDFPLHIIVIKKQREQVSAEVSTPACTLQCLRKALLYAQVDSPVSPDSAQ